MASTSNIRNQKTKDNPNEKVFAAFSRAYTLTDYTINNTLKKRYEFRKTTIYEDETLNDNEKNEAIRILSKRYEYDKIIYNEGERRTCENCQNECLAILYCEYCIRNYLKTKFNDWTSGNVDIDHLIQQCQLESIGPNKIIEWVPYNKLLSIEYLTKGGFSEIYSAYWEDGHYNEWNSEKQQLERYGKEKVIVKRLENVKNANRSWFEEAKSHLTISNKWAGIIQCYGLTQDTSDGDYMLVMCHMSIDLRNHLKQNHNILTWKKRIKIIVDIIDALLRIHKENAIHRDLHSGNILYLDDYDYWYISDLGFCGPADKPIKSIYGNLPYIAPEVIAGKEYTYASDIYSIGMLMWEISSGQPPFANFENDIDLVIRILHGMRPKTISGTPLEYIKIMTQCWDADPLKRPNVNLLHEKIMNLSKLNILNDDKKNKKFLHPFTFLQPSSRSSSKTNYTTYTASRLFTSKVHQFENLPEPKNATEEEQEAFHSSPYDFNITSDFITSKDDSVLTSSTSKSGGSSSTLRSKVSKVFEKFKKKQASDTSDNSK
ncbi:Ipl1p [Rhizophagus irregularis DAOM 197198w]|uniref:Ipl1p n=1 Tax=Rhizophagus irregularis (strain DAOM 197198w) TaxID=1432141 RepID=A0A015INR2_RHIIW|nr:Ipl1p [Rhizophagus irregularis DAOM 197198w]